MASLADVFKIESDRKEPEKWNKIHLFKIGDFWRSYEWSAWLIAVITYNDKVRMATRDRRPLQVTRMERTDVEFLGAFVKPYRDYVSNKTLERIRMKMQEVDLSNTEMVNRTVNSYLGILSHTASFNLRCEVFDTDDMAGIITFDEDLSCSKPQQAFRSINKDIKRNEYEQSKRKKEILRTDTRGR